MKMIPVESSMISSVGYDGAKKVLRVVFNSGAVWEYSGVPEKVYDELLAAGSKGSYMKDFVIDCYRDTRIRRAD
jgi:hypothetical protein